MAQDVHPSDLLQAPPATRPDPNFDGFVHGFRTVDGVRLHYLHRPALMRDHLQQNLGVGVQEHQKASAQPSEQSVDHLRDRGTEEARAFYRNEPTLALSRPWSYRRNSRSRASSGSRPMYDGQRWISPDHGSIHAREDAADAAIVFST